VYACVISLGKAGLLIGRGAGNGGAHGWIGGGKAFRSGVCERMCVHAIMLKGVCARGGTPSLYVHACVA
jgi:hypothetical protein